MEFRQYQLQSSETDQVPGKDIKALVVPLLGLAGETGSLLTLYKKYLRDGDAYHVIREKISEELGDILWYVADTATKAELDLNEVVQRNLSKTRNRWLGDDKDEVLFDNDFPEGEQLPTRFRAGLKEEPGAQSPRVIMILDGVQIGNELTDNSYDPDGYRYHDVFHLAYASILGWSPVLRANIRRKRKSRPAVDQVEDGGRAIAIEEGVSALVFTYAKNHSFLEGIRTLDWGILRTVHEMTAHLEVGQRSLKRWEQAILEGYRVWREVVRNSGGLIECDLQLKSIHYAAETA